MSNRKKIARTIAKAAVDGMSGQDFGLYHVRRVVQVVAGWALANEIDPSNMDAKDAVALVAASPDILGELEVRERVYGTLLHAGRGALATEWRLLAKVAGGMAERLVAQRSRRHFDRRFPKRASWSGL